MSEQNAVKQLSAEVARKIAAGEVIDRPNAIVRELMDNAVDSGATKISVEITGGGIDSIRVVDNGCGMTKHDLETCARPHATSKISSEQDLLKLTTLGFRGEALSSMAAVSRLEIKSSGYKMNASVTEDHVITEIPFTQGTIVQTSGLFENFPARRQFLKRPGSEATMCRATFEEKVLPRPEIHFSLTVDGEEKLNLPPCKSLQKRFVQTMEFFENENLFFQVSEKSPDGSWSYDLVIGEPSVSRSTRKDIFIFVNGRRIQEYSLVQAIEYGAQGFFPNGTHPVACLFVNMDPSLVDFNIHPAKREARFKEIAALHHGVSSGTRNFFKDYTVKTMVSKSNEDQNQTFDFTDTDAEKNTDTPPKAYFSRNTGLASSALDEDDFLEDRFKKPETSTAALHQNNELYAASSETSASSITAYYMSSQKTSNHIQTGSYDSVRRKSSPDLNSGTSINESASSSDYRSRYFSGQKNIPGSTRIDFDEESQRILNSFNTDTEDASVDGRTTKQNYTSTTYNDDKEFHFVGSTLGTFLIAEKNDVLYIIDQHAAHERYLYDQIVKTIGQKQELLVPYVIHTDSESEDKYLEEIRESLDRSGFTCSNCGQGKWEFTAVPIRWKGTEQNLKQDILDRRINPNDMINAFAASTACRMAVMDGTVLDQEKAAEIARIGLELPDPHCPHGRPVYTTITRKQLFTLVKRI